MATSHPSPVPLDLDALCAAEAKRIRTLRTQLVVFHPFWSTLQMPMQVELNLWVPTFAATDGVQRIWINPLWTRHLPGLKQLGYILLHEVAHVALLHALRRGPRDPHRWNDAADYAVNALLDDVRDYEGKPLYERPRAIEIPDLGTFSLLYDEAFKGLSAEAIYARLESHAPETCPLCGSRHTLLQPPISGAPNSRPQQTDAAAPQNGSRSNTPAGPPPPASHPHESPQTGASSGPSTPGIPPCISGHRSTRPVSGTSPVDPRQGNLFDNIPDAHQPPGDPGQPGPHSGGPNGQDTGERASTPRTSTNGEPHGNGHSGDPTRQPPCPNAPDFRGHCSPGRTCLVLPPTPSGAQAQELIDRVIRAHETWVASNQRGSLPATLTRFLRRLREAKVPWQRVLHTYAGQTLLKDDFSLNPPHRRWLEHDIIRPTLRSEGIAHLAISIDTSGSTQPILEDFAAEVAKLYTLSEETLILTGDAAIHQVIKTNEVPAFLNTLKLEGGGGTSHRPVFQWLKEHRIHPDLLVALTDLSSEFPDQPPPYPVLWVTKEEHGTAPHWPRSRVVVIPSTVGDLLEQFAA
jgi:predicted metal-dependent peptidase